MKQADPTFLSRNSCRLIGDNCKSSDHGKCIFYSCNDKKSNYKKWQKHHERAHPEDNLLHKISCDKCKTILEEEIHFMESRIAEFERTVNKNKTPNELLSTIESIVDADLDSILAEEGLAEGKMGQRYVTYYERNPKLRSKAIWYHGFKCMACGFDFQEKYGDRGSKFIEVHHLKPISSLEKETIVDHKTEMAVVCSNCHRMIRRKKDKVLSLKELREIIQVMKKSGKPGNDRAIKALPVTA